MSSDPGIQQLEEKLAALDAERARLILEINNLRNASRSDAPTRSLLPLIGRPAQSQPPLTPSDKIQLFLKLFRCREDVFPKRWENTKSGKQGYSPSCKSEWVPGVCGKPPRGKVKCSECPNQNFPTLDALAVENHLKGLSTIGTYAIREDDSCTFLACDFDEAA